MIGLSMRPRTIVGGEHHVFGLSVRLSVRPLSSTAIPCDAVSLHVDDGYE